MYRQLKINVVLSVAQTIVSGIVLFILYRYLIGNLGADKLGLWSVILAGTSVARLSEMGITGSVVKFIARYRAADDQKQAGEVVQTAAISIALVMAVLGVLVLPFLGKVLSYAVPDVSMPLATGLLPWAMLTLWLSSIGGVFQSGLDGCQRMDLRNIILMAGNIVFLVASFWLVPEYGLKGLAIGQAAQAGVLLIINWLVLRRQLGAQPIIPIQWRLEKFKEMFRYAVSFQITSIALLFFEPAVKVLMSKYAGLSSTGYYEMASQLVIKVRALVVSAGQALTPAAAALDETSKDKVYELYKASYRIVFLVTVPIFTGIIVSLPLVSLLWIGKVEPGFVIIACILAVGWGFNTLTTPAYFVNLGTGDLKWNMLSHSLLSVLTVALGFGLGRAYGGVGVVLAAMASLILASAMLVLNINRRCHSTLADFVPDEHRPLALASVLSIVFSLKVYHTTLLDLSVQLRSLIAIGGSAILALAMLSRHAYRARIMQVFRLS